jgi:hypothetical protein
MPGQVTRELRFVGKEPRAWEVAVQNADESVTSQQATSVPLTLRMASRWRRAMYPATPMSGECRGEWHENPAKAEGACRVKDDDPSG